jgi:uncharacterized protein DUF551
VEGREVKRTDWQPIATAPEDGTFYLGTDGKFMMVVNQPEGCARGRWGKRRGEWFGMATAGADELTHWMPLPEPPSK